jgi:hypothetical protein
MHFSTQKFIYTLPLPVSPFDDQLDYTRYLNVIPLRLNGPRNLSKRTKKFDQAKKPGGCAAFAPTPAIRGLIKHTTPVGYCS